MYSRIGWYQEITEIRGNPVTSLSCNSVIGRKHLVDLMCSSLPTAADQLR